MVQLLWLSNIKRPENGHQRTYKCFCKRKGQDEFSHQNLTHQFLADTINVQLFRISSYCSRQQCSGVAHVHQRLHTRYVLDLIVTYTEHTITGFVKQLVLNASPIYGKFITSDHVPVGYVGPSGRLCTGAQNS
jgi:hypothetical protein